MDNTSRISFLQQVRHLCNKGDYLKVAALILMMLVGTALEVLSISLVLPVVMSLDEPERLLGNQFLGPILKSIGATDQRAVVMAMSGGLVLAFVLKSAYSVLQWRAIYGFIYHRFAALTTRLFDAYIRAPYTFHLQRNSAELNRNINVEMRSVFGGVIQPLFTIVPEALLGLGLLILLLVVHPVGAAAALLLLAVGGLGFMRYARKRLELAGKSRVEHQGHLIRWLGEGLGAIKEVKLLNREAVFVGGIQRSAESIGESLIVNGLFSQYPRIVVESLGVSAIVILVLLLFLPSGNGANVLPVLALFGVALARLMPSVTGVISHWNSIRFNSPSLAAVYQQLVEAEEAAAIVAGTGQIPSTSMAQRKVNLYTGTGQNQGVPISFRNRLEVDHLSMRYSEAQDLVLKDVTLSVRPGQRVAIVGESGVGKTTLLNVILGLLEPTTGRVLVDGVDIRQDIRAWQRRLGYVPQDVFILDDTIRRNISFGLADQEVDDDQVWQALEAAQLETFIRTLKNDLDAVVGERGARLSGGQRQRIGIARALYQSPDMLVLDEATSSLDYDSERGVIAAIDALPESTSLIIVTHRLSSVVNCDRIYLLKEGRVADSGPYRHLMETNTEFRRLAQIAD